MRKYDNVQICRWENVKIEMQGLIIYRLQRRQVQLKANPSKILTVKYIKCSVGATACNEDRKKLICSVGATCL